MSRCPECYSKNECDRFCGSSLTSINEEFEELEKELTQERERREKQDTLIKELIEGLEDITDNEKYGMSRKIWNDKAEHLLNSEAVKQWRGER